MDFGSCGRGTGESGKRRPSLRYDRFLADLENVRRKSACDRLFKRLKNTDVRTSVFLRRLNNLSHALFRRTFSRSAKNRSYRREGRRFPLSPVPLPHDPKSISPSCLKNKDRLLGLRSVGDRFCAFRIGNRSRANCRNRDHQPAGNDRCLG